MERDIKWVNLRPTRIDLAERYLPYHNLENDLVYAEDPYSADIPGKRPFNLSEWGTVQLPGDEGAYD